MHRYLFSIQRTEEISKHYKINKEIISALQRLGYIVLSRYVFLNMLLNYQMHCSVSKFKRSIIEIIIFMTIPLK